MAEMTVSVALGVFFGVFGFLFVTWVILEIAYLAWLWKTKRKRRYHG